METFRELFREDTGAHFLDSGGAYGRHHERPPIPSDAPMLTVEKWTNNAGNIVPNVSINTGPWLDHLLKIRTDWTTELREQGKRSDTPWSDVEAEYMRRKGYRREVRDNSYNWESNLSQVFIISAWVPVGSSGDWIYNPDTLLTIQAHTGCDVRGGYTAPVIAEPRGSFPEDTLTCLLDSVIGVEGIRGVDSNSIPLSWQDVQNLTQRYSVGYTSAPLYEWETDVSRIFGFTLDPKASTVVCQLDTGEILKVRFYTSAEWY